MIRKTKTTKKKVLCNEFMSQFCHILNEVTQMSGLCLSIEAWSGPNQILNLNLTPPYIVLIFSLLLTEWIQKMKYHTRAIINHSQIVTAPFSFQWNNNISSVFYGTFSRLKQYFFITNRGHPRLGKMF